MQVHYQPYLQVRENCLLLYDVPAIPASHQRDLTGLQKAYSGKVSDSAAKRIRRAVDIFLQTTPQRTIWNPVINHFHPFRFGFLTLTVSENKRMLTAREGYDELLRPFLRWQKNQGVRKYIWKAELQARGQIHYHLTIDQFLHHSAIRNQWNKLQKKARLLDGYARMKGHFDANSVDIHSVKNIRNFEKYLSKYLAKAEQNVTSTTGKLWDCSQDLKRKRFSAELDFETNARIEEALAQGAKVHRMEHCTLIEAKGHKSLLSPQLASDYRNWVS